MQRRRDHVDQVNGHRSDPTRSRRFLGLAALASAVVASGVVTSVHPASAAGADLTVDYGVSISSVTEEDASISRTLQVFLDAPAPAGGVELRAFLTDGTASESSDFEAFDETVIILEGQTGQSFTITVLGDTVPEPDETFTIGLTAVTPGVVVATPSLSVTINDNDVAPPSTAGFRILQEIEPSSAADGTAFFYIVECSRGLAGLGGRSLGPVVGDNKSLEITTMFATPLAIGDICFVTPSGPSATPLPAGWAATPSARTSITVGDVGSTALTVTLRPVAPSGFRIVQEIDPASAADGTPFFYTLNCSRGPAGIGGRIVGPLTGDGSQLDLTTINSTPFAAGDSCEVTPVGSASGGAIPSAWSVSPATTQVVTAGDPAVVALTFTWQPTGPPPPPALSALSVGTSTVTEGNSGTTAMVFTLSLDQPAKGNESVVVNTSDGTATAGSDYVALTNQIVAFPVGATSRTVTVTVNGDTAVEADERLTLTLTGAQNVKTAVSEGIGTITNDDSAPPPPPAQRVVVISDVSGFEGNQGCPTITFTLTLDAPAAGNERVEVNTTDGTARSDSDYSRIKDLIVKFPGGATTRTVTVRLVGDKQVETDETFSLVLAKPNNLTIGDTEGIGTIVNDDVGWVAPVKPAKPVQPAKPVKPVQPFQPAKPVVSVESASVTEGNHGTTAMTVTVRLSAPSTETVRVTLETHDGTAKAGSDYVGVERELTFTPGQTSITATVLVKGDKKKEGPEDFAIELERPRGATLSSTGSRVGGRIIDDD